MCVCVEIGNVCFFSFYQTRAERNETKRILCIVMTEIVDGEAAFDGVLGILALMKMLWQEKL